MTTPGNTPGFFYFFKRGRLHANAIYMEKTHLTAVEIIRWCNKQKVTNRMRQLAKAYQKKLDKTKNKRTS